MPGCVLRATSHSFSPVDFLSQFPVLNASHRGNSLNVRVSDNDGDCLPAQVEDALTFLRAHRSLILALCAAAGGATLDFGLWRKDTFSQSARLPPELVAAAGELGLGLEVSIYDAAP